MNKHLLLRFFLAALFVLLCSLALPAEQEFQFLTFFDYYGGIEQSTGYQNLRTRLFMRPQISGFNEAINTEWVLSGTLWVQPFGYPYAVNPWDILHEAYLLIPTTYFDFTLGQKLVTYGFADLFGPLNVLHSKNSTPFSMDEGYDSRRPDPLVQLTFYPSFEDTIELTYVPVTRPDRERPDEVYLPESDDTLVWNHSPYLLAPDDLHSVFLNYRRYGEKFDVQLFYGWYTEHTPDFVIDEIDSEEETEILTAYNKKHTIGFAYATKLGSTTISQDIGFNLTSDFAGTDLGAQDSDITVNTQLLMYLPGNTLTQFMVVYSYFFNHGSYDTGDDDEAGEYLAEQIHGFHLQPLQHIAFAVVHMEKAFLREKLRTQLNAAFIFPNFYIGPRVAYSLTDHWTWETGIDYTTGNPTTADLRRNPADDNFYTRLILRY